MKRAATIAAMLAMVMSMALPAFATTDRIPFAGQDVIVEQTDPGRTWVSDDGVLHVRGSVTEYTATSNSEFYRGDQVIVVNYNLDLATMTGTMWGTSNLTIDDAGGFTGSWVGEFTGTQTVWVGHGRARGFGDFEGYQQRYDLAAAPFGDFIDGFTFIPGNRG